MNVSETIKQFRVRNRLTLRQFSELSGVDPATVNRLERGLGNPRPLTIYMITAALKLTPSEIYKKLKPDKPEIVYKPEAGKPDNNMRIDCSADVAYEYRTLKQLIDRIENLMLVVLTVQIITVIYFVFFVAK